MHVISDSHGIIATKIFARLDGQLIQIPVEVVARVYQGDFLDEHLSSWLVLHRNKEDGKITFFNTTNVTSALDTWLTEANLSVEGCNQDRFKPIIDKYEEFVSSGTIYERDRVLLNSLYNSILNKYMDRMTFKVVDTIAMGKDGQETAFKLSRVPTSKVKNIELEKTP